MEPRQITIQREQTADGQTVVTEAVTVTRQSYPQDWPTYNAAQTHEKSELPRGFAFLMVIKMETDVSALEFVFNP